MHANSYIPLKASNVPPLEMLKVGEILLFSISVGTVYYSSQAAQEFFVTI